MTAPQPPASAAPQPPAMAAQSVVPLVLFVVVNRIAGLRWAVVVATVWSVKVIVDRRRAGVPLGRFMPIVTAAVLLRGAIGAITESEDLYFGLGIASKYVAAAVLIGSVIVGRPLAAWGASVVLDPPHRVRAHSRYHRALAMVTVIGALYYAISASFDVWLYQRSSVEGYVVIRFLANWPLSAAALTLALGLTHRALRAIPGAPSLTELAEAAVIRRQQGLSAPLEDSP